MDSYWLPIETPIWAALQCNDVCDLPEVNTTTGVEQESFLCVCDDSSMEVQLQSHSSQL